MDRLVIHSPAEIVAENAGLFISPGFGRHPTRRITSYELILVRSGVLRIREECQEFFVHAGQALLLWQGREHAGVTDYSRDLSFYWMHFQLKRKSMSSLPWHTIRQQPSVRRMERLAELWHRFLDEQDTGVEMTLRQRSLLAGLMLLELGEGTQKMTQAENALAIRAERHIATHFRRGLRACDVAIAMSCNRDYLGRVYHRAYERTLTAGIHRHQILEACVLLREDNRNLEEIALATGFREPRNFRKVFVSLRGITPGNYRKMYSRVYVNSR